MRKFVLVTATGAANGKILKAAGIKKLKRGVKLNEFILGFREQLNLPATSTEILEREGETVVMYQAGESLYSWQFKQYDEGELFSAVAHLSREELLRDLNELLPLKDLR